MLNDDVSSDPVVEVTVCELIGIVVGRLIRELVSELADRLIGKLVGTLVDESVYGVVG